MWGRGWGGVGWIKVCFKNKLLETDMVLAATVFSLVHDCLKHTHAYTSTAPHPYGLWDVKQH